MAWPDVTFQGNWSERNWRNVPGLLYGAMTDNCWVGRLHAPRHVLYGDDIDYEQEFLYRQPRTVEELRAVVAAAQEDPWAGWACDGDTHWTPDLVREWWRDRGRLRDWITTKQRQTSYGRIDPLLPQHHDGSALKADHLVSAEAF